MHDFIREPIACSIRHVQWASVRSGVVLDLEKSYLQLIVCYGSLIYQEIDLSYQDDIRDAHILDLTYLKEVEDYDTH